MNKPAKRPTALPSMRRWQAEALDGFFTAKRRTWLTTATPGAGKTTYALAAALRMLAGGVAEQVYVVAPTDHLRTQWVEAAAQFGLDLRATPNNERTPADAAGVVVTYAQVAAHPRLHEARVRGKRTFAILDEVHHAGDQLSWGDAVTAVFSHAFCRFLLTGTPFRSDQAQIAHVTYEPQPDGSTVSVADYTYGYGEALRDRVVRPVVFATYTGDATWATSAGDVVRATLGDPELSRALEDQAWKTALDPAGEWIRHVFAAAYQRVNDYRRGSIPDAKVLIPAPSQEQARAYAEAWRAVTGDTPVVVLSDDPEAATTLARFRDDPALVCCVCVRMVTEGVDIPSCAVLVWSTTASTELFFRQMVGRVIRARNRREQATVFLPAVRHLVAMAATMERERDHVIAPEQPDAGELDDLGGDEPPVGSDDDEGVDEGGWKPLSAHASFDDVIGTGHEDLFGIDGLLTPDQVAALLRRQDEENRAAARRAATNAAEEARRAEAERHWKLVTGQIKPTGTPPTKRATLEGNGGDQAKQLRSAIARHVRDRASNTGETPQQVWRELYRATPGPKNPQATVRQLHARLSWCDKHW